MVYLGGPRKSGGWTKPLLLHDPPPGYRPPRVTSRNWLLNYRQAPFLVRVVTVILVVAAAVIIVVIIATQH